MDTVYFQTISGSLEAGVTVTEQADSTVLININVLDGTAVIGDQNGNFCNLAADSMPSGLTEPVSVLPPLGW